MAIADVMHYRMPQEGSVGIYRHGEKVSSDGPISHEGWMRAKRDGFHIGKQVFQENSFVYIQPSTVLRAQQTTQAVELGLYKAFVVVNGQEPTSNCIRRTSPREEISLSAIVDAKNAVLVQKYMSAMKGVATALDHAPWYKAPFLRKTRLEQEAAGRVMLEWLRLDNQRMKLPDGSEDPHTRSAREVAQIQAFFLRLDLLHIVDQFKQGRSVHVLKYSHENMVLLWARYFCIRKLRPEDAENQNAFCQEWILLKK